MATVGWVRKELDDNGISYEELEHNEAFTAQELAQREHMTGHRVVKVVALIVDGKPVELILPATKRVNLKTVGQLLHSTNVRLASEAEIQSYFGDCEVGAIPPFRHWKNVDLLMDTSMAVSGDILIPCGTHRDAIRVRFEDWFRVVQPKVGAFTASTI
jgi:Ala-tRNA(Pro) deacylase